MFRRAIPKSAFRGGGPASGNWRYFTEADRTGPRKSEMIMPTTLAKERFHLATSDLCAIQGYRQPGARSTLTMYYVNDLKAAAIRKFGQEHFDNVVPEGRELSGVAQKDRDEKAAKEAHEAQVQKDRAPFAVVPPERLVNLYMNKLQEILVRCEGGKKEPQCLSKEQCIERILASGKYDMEAESALMVQQKAAEDARQAQREIERAAWAEAKAKADAEAEAEAEARAAALAVKAKAKAEESVTRLAQFEAGTLSADELSYAEMQQALKRLGVPGKEIIGNREVLRAKVKAADAARRGAMPKRPADAAELDNEAMEKKPRLSIETHQEVCKRSRPAVNYDERD